MRLKISGWGVCVYGILSPRSRLVVRIAHRARLGGNPNQHILFSNTAVKISARRAVA